MHPLMGLKASPSPIPFSSLSEPVTCTSPVDVRLMMDLSWFEPVTSITTRLWRQGLLGWRVRLRLANVRREACHGLPRMLPRTADTLRHTLRQNEA